MRILADRHYNRQTPGAKNIAPPGRTLVLFCQTDLGSAFWITSYPFSRYVNHNWGGALVCSAFRNEGAALASLLITQALSASRHYYGTPIPHGMITFVDPTKVKPTQQPGWCFLKAGFRRIATTDKGLIVLQLLPDLFPSAAPPLPALDDEWTLRRRGI